MTLIQGQEERGKQKKEKDYNSRERKSRNSKDGKINRKKRKLVKVIEKRGWSIQDIIGDDEGKFMLTGVKKSTVINYVIRDKEIRKKKKENESRG